MQKGSKTYRVDWNKMKPRGFLINLFVSLFFLHMSVVRGEDMDVDLRDVVFEAGLKALADLIHVDESFVHIAMILTNLDNRKSEGMTTIMIKFKKMLKSIFLYSSGTPIHCIFITDEESMLVIEKVMKEEMGKYLSESVIEIPLFRDKNTYDKFPKLKIEFAEMAPLISRHRTQINMMKKYFNNHLPEGTVFTPKSGIGQVLLPVIRYNLDLFFIDPFYYLEFPEKLEKLIILDTDTELRTDISELFMYFGKFLAEEVVGVAAEQSLHYHNLATKYRKTNPGSKVGSTAYQVTNMN